MTDPAPEPKTPLRTMFGDDSRGSHMIDASGNVLDDAAIVAAYNALSADLAKLREERDDLKLIAMFLRPMELCAGGVFLVNLGGKWMLAGVDYIAYHDLGTGPLPVLTPEARAVLADAMKAQGEKT